MTHTRRGDLDDETPAPAPGPDRSPASGPDRSPAPAPIPDLAPAPAPDRAPAAEPGRGPGTRDSALRVALDVAERLRDPERVARITAEEFAGVPGELMLPGWQPASVLLGHPGVGLLHDRWARHDGAWRAAAHAHLAAATALAPREGPAAVGNLVLPALLGAGATGGYARLLERGTGVLAGHARARAAALRERRDAGLSYLDYDVVAGLTGQGRVLLAAAVRGDERAAEALGDVLVLLVALTEPRRVDGVEVPGWWCAPERYAVPRDRAAYPRGDFNAGAAHGVCGPLALLSLAHRAGHGVPGTLDALRRITDWLGGHAYEDGHGAVAWPGRVAFEEETGAAPPARGATTRAGWCYGTAGIACALHLAGRELGDAAVSRPAVDAMTALLARPLAELGGDDPGFCHGLAGVLHAAVRLAGRTGEPALWRGADRLADALVSLHDTESAFGYRQLVRTPGGTVVLESPSLIDGAAGVALTLLGYAEAAHAEGSRDPAAATDGAAPDGLPADWDAVFLTS
ncbi:lanthionine synthetase C family protein [Streptomyces globisporus]|uniref:lanthionine synthetase C family protein n=1 Tax=Streptomyces globisporus TaxID=1908 RepID=UPI00055AEFC1|nr:lanthionine synthetase C family protein [Streptomyces globisporus]